MLNKLNEKELYKCVKDYFGYKADMLWCNSEKKEVGCMLYDSFLFTCNVNDRYGSFGCGLVLQNDAVSITNFLGKRCSHNSDEKSIEESLKIVDNYCRMRLPDKFLQAYDEAYSKQTKL